jgi:2-amino-4-hydroxy-6-hydroxymethyldihydropteridine diphosphokinase
MLRTTPCVSELRHSAWHATHAIGGPPGQPEFLNGAAVMETSLPSELLLARLLEIEQTLGRVRAELSGPRTIDLDLLLYDDVVQHTPGLQLPHPRMAFRRFVLQPASEVASEMRHPIIGWTVAQLLKHVQFAQPYVAISGSVHQATRQLAHAVAAKVGWKLVDFAEGDDASPFGGLASLGLSQTIEFLRQQATLLDRKRWLGSRQPGAITPFWIEDLLAIGDALWPGAMTDAWQSLVASIVPPKLLVVYEATSQQFHESQTSEQKQSSSVAVALWHRLNEARRARAGRPGLGPVLWLEGGSLAHAEAELTAAIQAMA